MSESDDEVNRREVAYRLFAAEFDDADYSYAESDEERAPNYVVTPTGARVNRVFVVGVLTEVEPVNDDVVRARIVDPTGAFVVYAGQYQPEALASLEAAETPSFVAVTGKARTFEPDDADVIYTSIRPEHVSEVDADTRDRWVTATAEQTVERVSTMAAALERVERGDELQRVLEAADVPHGLAAGIPLALEHYETSPAYLAAVHDLALDAARVVAGDVEEVEGLSLAPNGGGDASLDFADTIDVDVEVGTDASTAGSEPVESGSNEATSESESDETADDVESGETTGETTGESAEPTDAEIATDQTDSEIVESADAPDVSADDAETDDAGTDDTEAASTEDGSASDETEATPADAESEQSDGEMYELSEEEREEVEENYDVGFSSGSDIPDAGEADIEAPEPDEPATGATDAADAETTDDEASELGTEATDADVDAADVDEDATDADAGADDLGDFDGGADDVDAVDEDAIDEELDVDDVDTSEEFTEEEYDDAQSEMQDDAAATPEDEAATSMERDLEDAVVDLMEELDDGDGAPRDEVITAAAEEYDADEGDIEDAIQSALMGGRCYESGDDHLKAI